MGTGAAVAAIALAACAGRSTLDASDTGDYARHRPAGTALFVQDVLMPQMVTPGGECVFTSEPSQPSMSLGVLDVAFRTTYEPTLLLGNGALDADASPQPSDAVEVQSVHVSVDDGGGRSIESFDEAASGFVDAGTGSVAQSSRSLVTHRSPRDGGRSLRRLLDRETR